MRMLILSILCFGVLCALGNHLPPFEWFTHPQPWIVLLMTLTTLLALVRKYWILSTFSTITTAYHCIATAAFLSLPFTFPWDHPAQHAQTDSFRVLQFNINANNPRYEDLALAIEYANADIFVLCEANQHVLNRLTHLHKTYPHRIETGRWPNQSLLLTSGTVMWSKFPFSTSHPLALGKGKVQVCHAIAQINDHPTAIYSTHLLAPRNEKQTHDRNAGLHELAQMLNEETIPNKLLIGDLNQTLWTPEARRFLKETGMHSVLKGNMFLSTWPAVIHPFGIAIDHILFKGNLSCIRTGSYDGIGSDHRMLIAEFTFSPPKNAD